MPRLNDSVTRTIVVTREIVQGFAEVTGDDNPIHVDEDYAAGTPFGQCIAHGMLAAGIISTTLAKDLPGPGTIYLSQTLKFTAPVYVGDTLAVSLTVIGLRPEKRLATLRTVGHVGDRQVVEGEAVVRYPEQAEAEA